MGPRHAGSRQASGLQAAGLLAPLVAGLLLATGCDIETRLGDGILDSAPIDPLPQKVDLDEDGYSVEDGDCDDLDALRGPSPDAGGDARFGERCDGIDSDCVGGIDADRDGFLVCAERATFVQQLQLDLLFVVDRHVSNETARNRAAAAAHEFVQHLVGPAFDTHVGVVTSDLHDAEQRGKLVLPPPLDPSDLGVDAAVATGLASARTYSDAQADEDEDTVPAGTDGDLGSRRWIDGRVDSVSAASQFLASAIVNSGVQEAGGRGSRAAVDLAMTTRLDSTNAGFFRPGAPLGLVFLSSEEDPTSAPDVTDFLAFLDDWSDTVKVHAVVQDTAFDCESKPAPEDEGRSYLDLVNLTSGLKQSVCWDDYGPFFSALGQYSALEGLGTRFPLAERARPESLQVVLRLQDGFSRALRSDEIALSDEGHTLVLLVDPPPPAGTEITVDYLRLP